MERRAWVSREQGSSIYLICPSCGGRMKVPHGQAGQKCRCARCNAVVPVSAPPPQSAAEAGNDDDGIGLSEPVERSPTAHVSPESLGEWIVAAAPAADSAPAAPPQPTDRRDMVGDQARKGTALAEAEPEKVGRVKPCLSEQPLFAGLFSLLYDRAARLQWLMLTLMLLADATLFRWIIELSAGSGIAQLASLLMLLAASLLSFALVAVASACFLTIVQDTAAGYDKVEHWPGIQITDWMMDVFYVVNGLLSAAFPGILLGGALMCLGGNVLSAIYGGAVSLLALFPILLISMVTEGSYFAVASPAVWSTLRTAWRLWGVFHLVSAGFALLLLVLMRWFAGGGLFLMGLGCAAAVAVTMIYFRLLGRLAWCLSKQPPC